MDKNKKPELLVTARNLEELELLINAGTDAIAVGNQIYGLRITGSFTLEMIKEAVELAHSKAVKIYVLMNALLHNEALDGIDEYIEELAKLNVDAIVFGDPAVLVTAKELAPKIPLHWNTETTATNYETVNYWATKGINRAILARELSLEEVTEIKKSVNIDIQVQVHGLTNIFHSKRNLVENYFEHTNNPTNMDASKERNMFLKEHQRPDESYPVFEDRHGTHVMSSNDICMIQHIDQLLKAGIDSLKIDGLMHSTQYLVKVTELYREAIDLAVNNQSTEELFKQILEIQPNNRPLTTGFYYKEQYY